MQWAGEVWRRLAFFLRRGQFQRELKEEMDEHVRMKQKDLTEEGMLPDHARNAARREFGNALLLRERSRDAWGFTWLEALVQDVRYGLRQLRRNPGFTAVAVITLALGIGASTAIFSVVYPVLVNPYPYKDADRIVDFAIVGKAKGGERDWYSQDECHAVRDQNSVFEGTVAFDAYNAVLSGGKVPEIVLVTEMTGNAFRYFGVPPLIGRLFTSADAPPGKAPAPVAVLSFRFWKRHYVSSRHVVGTTIRLDGKPYTVVGVLPRRFAWNSSDGVYLPTTNSWQYAWISARLRTGVTLGQARADVALIFHRLAKLHPRDYPPGGFMLRMQKLDDWALGSFRESLLLLVAAVGLLLLIACSNVANLQLARGSAREGEIAVRASVGASRRRIVRQLLTESVTLSLLGGALGILLAYPGVRLIVAIMPSYGIPDEAVLGVNGLALLFTAILSIVVGSLSGLAPALRLGKLSLTESLSHGEKGRLGRNPTRKALIAGEYAIALVLLVSAGLALRSFLALRAVRLGFDPSHILTMEIPVHWGAARWEKRVTVLNEILSRVKSLPGVDVAALSISTEPPPLPAFLHTSARIEAAPMQASRVSEMNLVGPSFFRIFGVPLVRGRLFTEAEMRQGRQVVLVSRSMARLLWPASENPVGARVHLDLRPWKVAGDAWPQGLNGWCQVVGIVADVRNQGLEKPPKPAFYIPYTLLLPRQVTLSVETAANPLLLVKSVRSAVASAADGQPVTDVSRYSDSLSTSLLSQDRFSAVLFLLFGILALALCASGIYSVVSYAVARRTHEIGIRMALGAQKGQVLMMVVRETMVYVLIGLGVGLLATFAGMHLIAHQLFKIRPFDPLTLLLASVILGAVALLASYIPARRATKVDPMEALRYE